MFKKLAIIFTSVFCVLLAVPTLSPSIMESDGEGGSLHFHKALPDDNGIIKKGRFTLINVYHRKDVGRFLLIPPGQTDDSGLVFYANPGDTVYVNGKGDIACLWSVNSKASEQKDWRMIQQATLAEEQWESRCIAIAFTPG